MLIFAIAAGVGVAAGLVLGGRISGLAGVRLRAPALIWLALGMQVGLGLPAARDLAGATRFGVVVASYGLIGAWLAANAAAQRAAMRAALGLLAAGWLLNLVVMVPNGGMPVSTQALDDIGAGASLDVEEGHLWKHVELSESTVLPVLADVMPVPALGSAVSAGDVAMVGGIAVLIAAAMVQPGRRQPDENPYRPAVPSPSSASR
ncbi:MAG TPA: DUF5317 family protein [Acidimicrobiales bacterium]|jgi:hypothetical protein|nr:DUF5317 family protein [Acidimicrobiales bacterium]